MGEYLANPSRIAQIDPESQTLTGARTHMTNNSTVEARLAVIEDRLEIYNLIASHGPSADTASEHLLRAIYTEDAVFDRGPHLHGAIGCDRIVAFAQSAEHQRALEGGLAHFGSLPLIDLQGDTANVTSYIMLISPDPNGKETELANHGVSNGFRVHRVIANRWGLVRTDKGWKINYRKVYPLDGSTAARELLAQASEVYTDE